MATKKLTLSADEEIIAMAHDLAKKDKTSVSAIFSAYIRSRVLAGKNKVALGPLARKALGFVEDESGMADHELLGDSLLNKYDID